MSDDDTSATDDQNEENQSYTTKAINYVSSLVQLFIVIIVYFGLSGLILYACKLGQSNILPSDDNCAPYTDIKPTISEIDTNIFIVNQQSMKLRFPFTKYNESNGILDFCKNVRNKSTSNFLTNFFVSILESLLQVNYSFLNYVFNLLNGLPETIIVLIGPIILIVLMIILSLIDYIYFFYLWFVNLFKWFFKKNENTTNQGKPIWKDVTFLNLFDYCVAWWLIFLFVLLFFIGFPLISFIPTLCIHSSILSCFMYKSTLNGKSASGISIIQNVLKYYKLTITTIFSVFLVANAFSNLGTNAGIFSIVTLILIYFGIIGIDMYKTSTENNLTPLVSFDQAKKTCSRNVINKQSGGDILKELKKISKKLSG